ncbi:hypothetical protein NP493_546g02001 [Ridgeia piscesae]|uniref:Membrane insertase YidC/Oxa/ALB C-terminal domain-containing protein n=1 Tax=Ridgeia piscesae TaxID=27915 RepID=A0AAD9KVC4_RIDPI|nr:hypothetical protein NP493_546g02001 [Ridgeia piscesae]
MSCLTRFSGVRCIARHSKLATLRTRQYSGLAAFNFNSKSNKHALLHRESSPLGHYITDDNLCTSFVSARHFSRESFDYYFSPEFPPIGYAEKLLETMHDATGLPWWASLALTTIMLRTIVTMPLSIYAAHISVKIERLQPEIKDMGKRLAGEVAMATRKFSWNKATAKRHFKRNMKRLVKDLYIRDNCHPMKTMLVAWLQLPMWFSLSFALRNMAGALPVRGDLPVLRPDLATEGALWFNNLLLPDTTFILPVTLAVSSLLITEMHALRRGKPTLIQNIFTYGFRGISIFMIPIAAAVPSCMCLYWTCSSLYGLTQNILLKCPSVRRAVGLPKMPSESSTPFRDMWEIAQEKYLRKKPADQLSE